METKQKEIDREAKENEKERQKRRKKGTIQKEKEIYRETEEEIDK
jgi:hypothetical protein